MKLLSNTQLNYNCINRVLQIDEQYLHIVTSKPDISKPTETKLCPIDQITGIQIYDLSKKWLIFWSVLGLSIFVLFNVYNYMSRGEMILSWVPLIGVIVIGQCCLIKRWRVDFKGGEESYFWQSQIINSKTNELEFDYILRWAKEKGLNIQDERNKK